MKKNNKFIYILFLAIFSLLVSCDNEDSNGELIVNAMVAEPGDLLNEAFPNTKVRVEGSGLSGVKKIILDNKVTAGFNSNYNSDKAFIFTVPFDIEQGSRFGVQPITFITTNGSITKDFEILQPAPTFFRTIPEKAVPGTTVEVEGDWFYGVSSVTFGGSALNYTVNSPTSIDIDLPANATSGSELVITTSGGSLTQVINFVTIVLVADFDGGGVRPGSGWGAYGDVASFSSSTSGGPTGNYAQFSWEGATGFGYNGCSGNGGANFLAAENNDASKAYIDIDISSNVVDVNFAIQLNTIEGKNYGFNFKSTEIGWRTVSLRLSDFKDNYGFGAVTVPILDPSKINEIKLGVAQGDTPNPSVIKFDNIKVRYE